MSYLPFIVLPAKPPAINVRNFFTRRQAVAHARLAANRRRVCYVVFQRTPIGARLVRRQEPERSSSPE